MTTPTPMMAQWHECKEKAKDSLLFFRLGDFYEAFYQDAETIAKSLSLTLTKRQEIPMCGVPFHTAEGYIDKLIAKGYRVAVAEQRGSSEGIKGPMKREIDRIITPGTLVNSQLLSDKKNNFFASLAQVGSTFGLGMLDLSTGQFSTLELNSLEEVLDEVSKARPAEFLVCDSFEQTYPSFFKELSHSFSFLVTRRPLLNLEQSVKKLSTHIQSSSFTKTNAGTIACGSILSYLTDEMGINIDHIQSLEINASKHMGLDRSCLRNLELTESMHEHSDKNTLLECIDSTRTPMGGRLLSSWLKAPLLSVNEILKRQEKVSFFLEHRETSEKIRTLLSGIRDLERLIMRVQSNCAGPRDILSLGSSLSRVPEIQSLLNSKELEGVKSIEKLIEILLQALDENPPLRISEGGIFKQGYDEELDRLKKLSSDSTTFLARYQGMLREKSGIKTLKVGFTKAFGYYIEVSRAQSGNVPKEFQRRQTLVNAERFVTDELKKYEHQILSAEERSKALESSLFQELIAKISIYGKEIRSIAREIGKIDSLLSLAKAARDKNLNRPVIDLSDKLEIVEGRHMVVEEVVGSSSFIGNDTALSTKNQMMLITGPNMAGKSTYIRQVALIVILAQIGSFVPAKSAHIGIVDQVFSRIGASDDLARGQSTFMVEMTETANILQNATSRSLVLLDEIGRGTSTYDGISIAWAVAEYLLTKQGKNAKTLFATHYWELTKLSDQFENALNFQIAVKELSSGIVFLRKIVPGGTDKSYGIHVAKLAGVPQEAILRAEGMLRELEKGKPKRVSREDQLDFFDGTVQEQLSPIVEELKQLNLDQITPFQALEKLIAWKGTL